MGGQLMYGMIGGYQAVLEINHYADWTVKRRDGRSWNDDALNKNLIHFDVEAAKRILLWRVQSDFWAWSAERHGMYSVRSAYRMLTEAEWQKREHDSGHASHSVANRDPRWMKLWKQKLRTRHEAVTNGQAALAATLTSRLAAANLDSNLVFSPLSIHAALSLFAAGAGGATLAQLLAVLGAASLDDLAAFASYMATTALAGKSASGGPHVAFASGVWCDAARPLKAAYRDAVVGEYKAEATTVNFKNNAEEAREQINEWTRQTTKGLIDSILPPQSVNELTSLVLGNAIYFKGNWAHPFKAKNTQKKPFYRLDGGVVHDVPFMSSTSNQYIAVYDGYKVLRLKYTPPRGNYGYFEFDPERTQHSMLVFLPDERDGLRGLVERIASRPGFLRGHTPSNSVPVGEFRVPKFKVSFGDSFVEVLGQMGLRLPFSTELADLSDMVEDGMPLFVSDVVHKAVIEVNEEGTEAAAATMMFGAPGCPPVRPEPPPPVDFVADHPFPYFIVEEVSPALAARLLKRVSAGAQDSNLIFSPLSIHLEAFVRGVVMDRVLADQSPIGGPCVSFACGSWIDKSYSLKPSYRDSIVETYKGHTSTVDFKNNPVEARKEINAWVAAATKNLITEVINPHEQSNNTRNVVGNAIYSFNIYFKGEWVTPFPKSSTAEGEFRRLDGGNPVDAPFMHRPPGSYHYIACHDGFKVLRLPYKSTGRDAYNHKLVDTLPSFSMLVFLPDDRDGLWRLIEMITSSPEFVEEHIPYESVPVGKFRIPKFKLTFSSSISDDLFFLGLRLPFDDILAEMWGIAEKKDDGDGGDKEAPMYVSGVIHKAVVEMNEEGSEAAAYTEESDDDMGFSLYDDFDSPPPPVRVDFVADHPFAFFIVEETSRAVVFAGHVVDLSVEGYASESEYRALFPESEYRTLFREQEPECRRIVARQCEVEVEDVDDLFNLFD
uniref:Serpin domain-containing protein n=1 Tax=Leersia perrieri TaxID=77586 RepID=A0A0D9XQG3_9ORYZ